MKINVLNANIEHDIGKWIYLNTIHKYRFIEIEIIPLIKLLDKFMIKTTGCCCGHREYHSWVSFKTYNDMYQAMKVFKDYNVHNVVIQDVNFENRYFGWLLKNDKWVYVKI